MLSKLQKEKLERGSEWDSLSSQQKANFNKNMRRVLEKGIKELSDMILLLKKLPPQVLENAELIEDLPKVVKFMDIFLETIAPLPVAKFESGDMRVFLNYAYEMTEEPTLADFEKAGAIKNSNEKKYIVRTLAWTAFPIEISRCELLKKHIENIQKYVDPAIVRVCDHKQCDDINSKCDRTHHELEKRGAIMGQRCDIAARWIRAEEDIPTIPPSKPRIIIEDKADEEGEA